MASTISGEKAPRCIEMGSVSRVFARYVGATNIILGGLLIFSLAIIAYLGSLPKLTPVFIGVHDDGTTTPYTQTLDAPEVTKRRIVGDWVSCWRRGGADAGCVAQVAAQIPVGSSDVTDAVRDYNQQIADQGAIVTPAVKRVDASGDGYDVHEDEMVAVPGKNADHRSYVFHIAVARDQSHVALESGYLNPFGLYMQSLSAREINLGSSR